MNRRFMIMLTAAALLLSGCAAQKSSTGDSGRSVASGGSGAAKGQGASSDMDIPELSEVFESEGAKEKEGQSVQGGAGAEAAEAGKRDLAEGSGAAEAGNRETEEGSGTAEAGKIATSEGAEAEAAGKAEAKEEADEDGAGKTETERIAETADSGDVGEAEASETENAEEAEKSEALGTSETSGTESANGKDEDAAGSASGAEKSGSTEADEIFFSLLGEQSFVFASGVGGWQTQLNIHKDGSFDGEFIDGNMGETGEGYPYGTVYISKFEGRFGNVQKIGDKEYRAEKLSLTYLTPADGSEEILDGTKYIYSEAYGLETGKDFYFYFPGIRMGALPKDFVDWVGMPRAWGYDIPEKLPFYGLFNKDGGYGFFGNEDERYSNEGSGENSADGEEEGYSEDGGQELIDSEEGSEESGAGSAGSEDRRTDRDPGETGKKPGEVSGALRMDDEGSGGLAAEDYAALSGEGRNLTEEEIREIDANLDFDLNGFFVSTFYRPEEIQWREVMYNGAGIAVNLTDEQYRRIEEIQGGELETGITPVYRNELEDFVLEKTGVAYADMRHPLEPYWDVLESDEGDILYFLHGDTNVRPIRLLRASADDEICRLTYLFEEGGYVDSEGTEYVMTVRHNGSPTDPVEWTFLSNLPADGSGPVTMLNIEFFKTEEEALAQDVTEQAHIPELASDQPDLWCWAVITARQDALQLSIERPMKEEGAGWVMAGTGVFVPGETVYEGALDKGESLAVNVSPQWVTTMRLTVSGNGYYGQYSFGEENWLHREYSDGTPKPVYVTGHDFKAERCSAALRDQDELNAFLENGEWVYYDEISGGISAVLKFDGPEINIFKQYETYQVWIDDYSYDYDSADNGAPNLLMLKAYEPETQKALPEFFADEYNIGDFLLSARQEEDRQVLTLTQYNNGDGGLLYLLDGANEFTTEFRFYRYIGTED